MRTTKALVSTLGWLAALCSGYLLLVSISAIFYRPRRVVRPPRVRLVVFIPAHNEEVLVARSVGSMLEQSYPRELYSVAVIADNCTDGTARAARAAGADIVLERDEPHSRGKGQALRWALDQVLTGDSTADAVVIVDADSLADRELLANLVAEMEAGAVAVQADYVLRSSGAAGSDLRVAAFILVNRVRQAGRAALGQTAFLVGNGMLLTTDLLQGRPWGAFTSTEDLEYTMDLALDGVTVAFAADAHVSCDTAPNGRAAAVQQRRWEGGRLRLARARVPQLVAAAARRRRPGLLIAAVEIAMPPLGLLAGAVATGGLLAGGIAAAGGGRWVLRPWKVAAAALYAYVLVGLAVGRAPRSAYRALAGAPMFILRKPAGLLGVLRFRSDSWERTQRAHEVQPPVVE